MSLPPVLPDEPFVDVDLFAGPYPFRRLRDTRGDGLRQLMDRVGAIAEGGEDAHLADQRRRAVRAGCGECVSPPQRREARREAPEVGWGRHMWGCAADA